MKSEAMTNTAAQWFVGVDWAHETHQVCVLGTAGVAQLLLDHLGERPARLERVEANGIQGFLKAGYVILCVCLANVEGQSWASHIL
jgi:hypothetical protein